MLHVSFIIGQIMNIFIHHWIHVSLCTYTYTCTCTCNSFISHEREGGHHYLTGKSILR